jgi:hypothetical protein
MDSIRYLLLTDFKMSTNIEIEQSFNRTVFVIEKDEIQSLILSTLSSRSLNESNEKLMEFDKKCCQKIVARLETTISKTVQNKV